MSAHSSMVLEREIIISPNKIEMQREQSINVFFDVELKEEIYMDQFFTL